MLQNMLMNMVIVGIGSMAAGVAVSTFKHYYEKYAELEDMKTVGVQEVSLVSETTEVEE